MSHQVTSRPSFRSHQRGRDWRDPRTEAELLRSQKRGSIHHHQSNYLHFQYIIHQSNNLNFTVTIVHTVSTKDIVKFMDESHRCKLSAANEYGVANLSSSSSSNLYTIDVFEIELQS